MVAPIEPYQETIYRLFPRREGDNWTRPPGGLLRPISRRCRRTSARTSLVLNEFFALDIVLKGFRGVHNYETSPPEARAQQLVIALFRQSQQLQRQLRLQLQKTNALEERIGALEGKTKLNKRRKSK